MKTHDGRKLSPQAQQELRHRVVHAILEEQMSQTEACRILGVGRTSIYNGLNAHRKGGDVALKAHKRGPKHQSRLAGHQAATIVRLITDRCPDQLKLPFALWTRDAVRELIEKRCALSVSVWTVGRYLKHWGFTPQKPLRRAYEQDPEAVQRWLEHDYPVIRQRPAQNVPKSTGATKWGCVPIIRLDAVMVSRGKRQSSQEPVSGLAAI